VYAENPPQNEPRSEGGWETLRWAYARLRESLERRDFEVLVVHSPHWKTVVGTHLLGCERFQGLSVDPVFPNLFRYRYDVRVDLELAGAICEEALAVGLHAELMQNPAFRVDYGTLTACHLVRPAWDKPIVGISSSTAYHDYSSEVGDAQMLALGEATRRAIERSGRRAVLLASCSLSHRHFTQETELPEDMSREHIYHHGQYLWDMRVLDRMRTGACRSLLEEMPDFIEQTVSECQEGSLTWLLGALGVPAYPATIHGYGSVIGTGNAVVEWDPARAEPRT
jgi:2-aminophenol/2-amino-5-chlorophenol 1,6-dioxygenase beta subunit